MAPKKKGGGKKGGKGKKEEGGEGSADMGPAELLKRYCATAPPPGESMAGPMCAFPFKIIAVLENLDQLGLPRQLARFIPRGADTEALGRAAGSAAMLGVAAHGDLQGNGARAAPWPPTSRTRSRGRAARGLVF